MQFKVGEKVMVNGVPYTDGTLHLSKLPEPAAEPEPGDTGLKCHAAPSMLNTAYRCLLPKNHGGECHYTRVRHG
jgi:hypothetical protein